MKEKILNWIGRNAHWIVTAIVIIVLANVVIWSEKNQRIQTEKTNEEIKECYQKIDDIDWCLNVFNN